MTENDDEPGLADIHDLAARAREARRRAEVLRELAFEGWVESVLVAARAERVVLAPAVEAALIARLSSEMGPRAAEGPVSTKSR